jgi:hypothetical protein
MREVQRLTGVAGRIVSVSIDSIVDGVCTVRDRHGQREWNLYVHVKRLI